VRSKAKLEELVRRMKVIQDSARKVGQDVANERAKTEEKEKDQE